MPLGIFTHASKQLAHPRVYPRRLYLTLLYYYEDLATWTREAIVFESERAVWDGNSLLRWKLEERPARGFFRLQIEVP